MYEKDSKKSALIPKEQYYILLENIIEAQNSQKKYKISTFYFKSTIFLCIRSTQRFNR